MNQQELLQKLTQAAWVLGVLAVAAIVIFFINWLFNLLRKKVISNRYEISKGVRLGKHQILDAHQVAEALLLLLNILNLSILAIGLYLVFSVLLSLFPATQPYADLLLEYLLKPIRNIAHAVLDYIPNAFTITIIFVFVRYLLKILRSISERISSQRIKIQGFYPEWAVPTYKLVRALIFMFTFVAIFPYLPGSDSRVFQGVSVFLGVLISVGSSSSISNIVSGILITYMRPFKIGDYIKVGDVSGVVMGKDLLVTRIRSFKNEDITIPNSTILSSNSTNYTSSGNYVFNTSITIGYDTSWRTIHELLTAAALRTQGISASPEPFVLQTALNDFYVSYELNAYSDNSVRLDLVYSALHQHIHDTFDEAGVEIMSPHYTAFRDGNSSTVPSLRKK
ncbi:Mechanosensitive ion channel [Flexibacter flexilis DSM 6793]|uniref:Mechanosensitive ion channel n=1 Tax=Flexibacter flexilis DSM 6793 TaxID=927664 RepID=A0A1I1J7V6_9BACT|nr:mechanosensitive ion channel domain-containing protein [Flexibacter flexilis]SFC44677.1 Mechanosensitive ion channel [Flexibacter flexilis DSM 6793]